MCRVTPKSGKRAEICFVSAIDLPMHTAWVMHTVVQGEKNFFPLVYFLTFKILMKFVYYHRLSQKVIRELALSLKEEPEFLGNLFRIKTEL